MFEKQMVQAVANPFLERLDKLQSTLEALLELERRRDVERVRREQRGEQP